jgi:hypothetical protein
LPYISKAERERARWMTLNEAVDRICQHHNCDRREAIRQIRKALADNALAPLRWEDQLIKPNFATLPPIDRRFWEEARFQRGRVFDPWTKQWRVLLIPKLRINEHWPERTEAASDDSQTSPDGGNVYSFPKPKVGATSARAEFDRAYDQLRSQLGDVVETMPPMELARALAKMADKKLGDPKWSTRTLLEYIQSIRNPK